MHIKFRGLIFRVSDWQENSWGLYFRHHVMSGVEGYIKKNLAEAVLYNHCWICSCRGLIFMDKRHTTKIYTP